MADSAEKIYNLEEASLVMNLNKNILLEMLNNGRLKGIKLGSTWGITQTTLNNWFAVSDYIDQINPNLAKRQWTEEEIDTFVTEDKID